MPDYVALLRAVNLGGASQVNMGDLRDRLTGCGFENVRTLLNSGNVVLRSDLRRREEVEGRIEREIAEHFGQPTDCLVRTSAEWGKVISGNPFARQAEEDPARLTALVLKATPAPAAWERLRAAVTGREVVHGAVDWGYIVYPDGQGRSRLTADRIARALGVRGTIRNWNTVGKIGSLLVGSTASGRTRG